MIEDPEARERSGVIGWSRCTHTAGGDASNSATVRKSGEKVGAALKHFDWSSAEGKFLAFRLILVLPFPAAVMPPADPPSEGSLTRALGELMDAVCVRHSYLKDLANYWVDWGGRAYDNIMTAWLTAVNANPAAPRRPLQL